MSETTDAPGAAARILVVEDSPLNQQIALKQLEKLGYQATAVSDGSQAVEAHAQSPQQVILMDCQMPGTNGYDATMMIRDREAALAATGSPIKRVHIIAMTANAAADSRARCLAAGMDDFIEKPVQLPELEAALRRALAERPRASEADAVINPVAIAALRQLRMPGKPDPLVDFIGLFLREAPAGLESMTAAVTQNDATSLTRVASAAAALKGSAENLGARRLAALCEEIEQTAREWMLVDTQPVIERARQEFDRVRAALEQIKAAG